MIDGPSAGPLLILVPLGRGARDAAFLLGQNGIECRVCADLDALCAALDQDTGAVLVADGSLAGADLDVLSRRLASQPSWSDLPFIVLTRVGPMRRRALAALHLPEVLGNAVFLELPLSALGLVSAVQSAMRARSRQWQLRDRLEGEIAAVALRKSDIQVRGMADSVPALIRMSDVAAQVIFANRYHETVFGRPVDKIISQGWMNLVLPEDREKYQTLFRAAFDARASFKAETRMRDKSGQTRWLRWEGVPRLDESGRFLGYTTCGVDVTDAREAVDELRNLADQLASARDAADSANAAKSRFLAGMSHELRTPLNGVLGYAQLLRMEGGLNEKQVMRVDAMTEAGKHLLQLISGVLDMSRIEAKQETLRGVELDVGEVAASCLDLVRPAAAAKNLALSLVVAAGSRRGLVADPTRLRQVLANLLGNAVKFTTNGMVEIRVSPGKHGSTLRFEVADTGPGIPANQRQKLFADFERLDATGTSAVEGAGLGLALSARITTLMGGRLGHDDNPGGGSVFWLELPLNVAPALLAAPPKADVADAHPAAQAPSLHVLIVDDVAMNRDIASSFLRAAGQQVDCVDGGAEAVAAVVSTDFDVVLMDVRMPEMDGLEATRRIRALRGPRGGVPIVALTAQAFTEQVAECRNAGMDDHLLKPFSPETLLATVLRAASAAHATDKLTALG